MVTLQEYLNNKYPTKEERQKVELFDVLLIGENIGEQKEEGELDLSEYVGLKRLSNPEKLFEVWIDSNNIQPTDIAFFSRFKNLTVLHIGNTTDNWIKHNQFYGSFESLKDLSKLRHIYIEATDINEGLEYLPLSLAEATGKGEKCGVIECFLLHQCQMPSHSKRTPSFQLRPRSLTTSPPRKNANC